MASKRNDALAAALIRRAGTGRLPTPEQMRKHLEAAVHPDGSRVPECVILEWEHEIAKQRRTAENRQRLADEANDAHMQAVAKRREARQAREAAQPRLVWDESMRPSRAATAIHDAVVSLFRPIMRRGPRGQ